MSFADYGAPSGPTPGSSNNAQADKTPGVNQQVLISRGTSNASTERGVRGRYDMTSTSKDHTETVATQARWFASLRGADLVHLQDQLEAGGFLHRDQSGKPTYGRGIPGDYDTYQAYMTMIGQAIFTKRTIDETLADAASANKQFADTGVGSDAKPQGRVFQPVATEDVEAAGATEAPSLIGRGITDAEVANYRSAYMAIQEEASKAQYAAEGSGLPGGPGGTVPPVPNLSSFLLDRIRKDHPKEYQDTQYRSAVHAVIDLINKGGIQ